MAKSKFVKANEKIADVVVGAYKKVENGFVEKFLTHEGETVEEAKARLSTEMTIFVVRLLTH